jgi:isoquinoline 1-oxidoreductase subunit beta
MQNTNTTRRDFLKTSSLTGVGLMLGFSGFGKNSVVQKIKSTTVLELEINPFIIIKTDGSISLINPRPDMGQGSTQAAPSLIAEELEVRLEQVSLIQSDGKQKYGSQQSGGSSTVRGLWTPLRKAGAAAKEMMIEVAAKRWNVPVGNCYAQEGKVLLVNSDKSFSYGELVEDASKLTVPANPKLKDPKDFKIIGKYNPRLDVPDRATGKAVYGIDIDLPGMVYACIAHSPSIHGKVVSINDAAAKKVPGVLQVVKTQRPMPHRRSDAVAVIATNFWAAQKGRKVLDIQWDNGSLASTLSTDVYFKACYESAKKEGINHEEKGDFAAKFANAQQKMEAIYETPFLAHAPIEPECAVVHVRDDGFVDVWAHVQGPDGALGDVSRILGVPTDKIKINVPLLGGSFGRKAYHDYLNEACLLSKELKKPVKVIWTREDDITQGPYRPGMLSSMQGFVKNGKIGGFHHHAIGESILGQVFNGLRPDESDPWLSSELSSENNKYEFPTAKVSWSNVKTDIPVVWWRSVYASNFAWGQECFIDELAHAAQKDPLETRLASLTDDRYKNVLKVLAEKSGYKDKLPEGWGRGIAVFASFGSISAAAITVSKKGAGVKIEKVISVIDCGYYVNPDNVKAQTEGNIVMGISAAVKGGITFSNGACDQSNFHNYNVMRINEAPQMEIHIIDSGAVPGGVGEPGLPPIAPALGNAIFNLTGKRIRKLPFDIDNIG